MSAPVSAPFYTDCSAPVHLLKYLILSSVKLVKLEMLKGDNVVCASFSVAILRLFGVSRPTECLEQSYSAIRVRLL